MTNDTDGDRVDHGAIQVLELNLSWDIIGSFGFKIKLI